MLHPHRTLFALTFILVAGASGVTHAAADQVDTRWVVGQSDAPALGWELLAEDVAGITLRLQVNWVDQTLEADGPRFQLPGEGWSGLPGDPALPALGRLLAAPGDATASLELLGLETEIRPGSPPAVQAAPQSDRPDAVPVASPPSSVYHGAESWPSSWAELGESSLWLGQRVQALTIHPLRWSPAAGRYEMLRSLVLRVTWHRGLLPTPAPRQGAEEFRNLVRTRTLNPDSPWLDAPSRVLDQQQPGRYLVLAPDAAVPGLADWILWKRQMGYEVRLVPESAFGGIDATTAQVRAAVQAEFAAAPFDYLLLVGDVDRYPSGTEVDFNLMGDFIPGGQYAETPWGGRCGSSYCIVTDHPFALQEGDDYFADLLVGRFSVDTSNDLRKMVARSVSYEAIPFLDLGADWFQRGLMIYEMTGGASRRETKLSIRQLLMENLGYTQVDTILNRYWSSPVSPEIVRQRVNNGLGVLNYRGYGFRDQWYGPMFGTSHVNNLTNVGRWPLVTSIVCGGGDFASIDDDPSFGEAWLRAGSNPQEPTGAIGFVGPSEEDTHIEWNNAIDEGIYHGMAREGLRGLGALMDAGKMGLWQAYPNARAWGIPGYNVPFYFHAYNLQGDPGLQLRTAPPRGLTCDTPDTLAAGMAELELSAVAVDAQPIDDLWGCLHHAELDMSVTARAGADGRLRFRFDVLSAGLPAGQWTLTLWGRDLLPLQRDVLALESASLLRLLSWELGESDEDGLARPGEILALHPVLEEIGTVGHGQTRVLTLAAPAGGAQILGEGVVIDGTAPGQVLAPVTGLEFRLAERLPYGDPVRLDLLLDGSLLAGVEIIVSQSGFQVLEAEAVDGDLEPGTECGLRLRLQALGLPVEGPLITRLGAFHMGVHVLEGVGQPLAIDPDSSAWVEGFRVSVEEGVLRGSLATFELGVWDGDGGGPHLALVQVQLPLGQVQLEDPLGPDAGGYLALHSSDADALAPLPVWDSIADTGQELVLFDWYDPSGEDPDGWSQVVDLPFAFRYYGQEFLEATICSNGWLAFGAQPYIYTAINTPIPAAQGPSSMIAAYWTDLVNSAGGAQAFGHLYVEARPEQGLFIVEWNHFRPVGSSSNVDVQLILRDPALWPTPGGNGEILMQFHAVATNNGDNGVTIGLETPDERDGLVYAFNNQYAPAAQPLTGGSALLFTPMEAQNKLGTPGMPASPELLGVHPNPFNPVTRMLLVLPEAAQVRWRLINLLGQTLMEQPWEDRPPGAMSALIDGTRLASGVYLLSVDWQDARGRGGQLSEKLLLLR